MYFHTPTDSSYYHQRFFRPSCLPALNVRFQHTDFFIPYYEKKHDQIALPSTLTKTPEDTLLNYFSILREAYYSDKERSCGTIGNAQLPFPISYQFLSKEYQKSVSYEKYLHSFAGIGHTTLIKLVHIPNDKDQIQFFYELETIQVVEGKNAEYFGYSYGFINLIDEENAYRISAISNIEEDFLCAPYHGWDQDGETIVDVKYGQWCHLLKERYPTINDGYIKYIYFRGNDGSDYCILFITLTNGTDLEIAQYRKFEYKEWEQVDIKPEEDCLGEKENM